MFKVHLKTNAILYKLLFIKRVRFHTAWGGSSAGNLNGVLIKVSKVSTWPSSRRNHYTSDQRTRHSNSNWPLHPSNDPSYWQS